MNPQDRRRNPPPPHLAENPPNSYHCCAIVNLSCSPSKRIHIRHRSLPDPLHFYTGDPAQQQPSIMSSYETSFNSSRLEEVLENLSVSSYLTPSPPPSTNPFLVPGEVIAVVAEPAHRPAERVHLPLTLCTDLPINRQIL